MPTLNYAISISGLGGNISRSSPRTADGGIAAEIALPPGKSGTLTTRTDNETGSLTMAAGHGITTAALIDLYWAGGARYGITVGTVSGNTVPIGADNSGTGSNLPTATTSIVAYVQVPFNIAIDGDRLSLIAIQMAYADLSLTTSSRVLLNDADTDPIVAIVLEANTPRVWDIAAGDTNPFTGDPITNGLVSNASTTAATLKIYGVQDTTP